eukprot:6182759-Pleurochrysis_carterae.AAC.4
MSTFHLPWIGRGVCGDKFLYGAAPPFLAPASSLATGWMPSSVTSDSRPKLDNPYLLELTEMEHEFFDLLALRWRQMWSAVRNISMSICADAAAKTDAHYER